MADSKKIKRVRINALSFAKLMAALVSGPCSYRELRDACGLHQSTIDRYVDALRAEKLVRVCGWDKDARGGYTRKVFQWAPGKEDARRRPKSGAQRQRDYRARQRIVQPHSIFRDTNENSSARVADPLAGQPCEDASYGSDLGS